MLQNIFYKNRFVIICVLFVFNSSYSQKTLDLHYHSFFGKNKSFQFFNNSNFSYKLKGDLFYKTNKLVNLQDSLLIFNNDSVIKLFQIKSIKIDGAYISPYPIGAGILFLLLDTGHNIAFHNPRIISNDAIYVVSIGAVASIILHRIQDKHVRINKNSVLRILDLNFQNLNSKP